jgi:hypothetical protein
MECRQLTVAKMESAGRLCPALRIKETVDGFVELGQFPFKVLMARKLKWRPNSIVVAKLT